MLFAAAYSIIKKAGIKLSDKPELRKWYIYQAKKKIFEIKIQKNNMIKTFIFIFLVFSAKVFPQIYYDKIIKPEKKWFVGYKYALGGGNCQPVYEEGNLFSFSNDTIINNKKYYKLKPGNLLVREDSVQKKVYGLLPWFNPAEKLMFDFNANAGDTIFNLFCYGKYFSAIEHLLPVNAYPVLYGECNINLRNSCTGNNYLVVDNIDSVFFCNKKRKRMTFKNSIIEWIEGIGYKSGFLECASLFKLKCFYENQCSYDFISQSENTYSCGIITGTENKLNSAKNHLKIRMENHILTLYSETENINYINIRDVLGRTLTDLKNLNQPKISINIPDDVNLIIITLKYFSSKTDCIKYPIRNTYVE
jgi:hypothetical protein